MLEVELFQVVSYFLFKNQTESSDGDFRSSWLGQSSRQLVLE